ncbi:MAG: hypothetical protein M3R38_17580 [Actinomycetota bacterium]|nr:hypothetical protein [Actinomycetota bacterium]
MPLLSPEAGESGAREQGEPQVEEHDDSLGVVRVELVEAGQEVEDRVERRRSLPGEDERRKREAGEVRNGEPPSSEGDGQQGEGEGGAARVPQARLQKETPISTLPSPYLHRPLPILHEVAAREVREGVVLQAGEEARSGEAEAEEEDRAAVQDGPQEASAYPTEVGRRRDQGAVGDVPAERQ